MGIDLRPLTAASLLVVVLAVGAAGSFVVTEAVEEDEPEDEVIELATDDRSKWLYTSRGQSLDRATLALNVVVYEDVEEVERRLVEEGAGNWTELDEDELDTAPDETETVVTGGSVEWERTVGDQRYTLLLGDDDQWLTQSFELGDGEYLGQRYHLRVYTPPDDDGEWTVIQAHDEYWDLFDARHVVTSVEEGQSSVEDEFIGGEYEVTKKYVGGEDRVDFDGWITVIDPLTDARSALLAFAGVGLVVGAVGTGRDALDGALEWMAWEEEARALALGGGLVALYVGVRLAAVFLERTVDVAPNTIAAVLHPFLLLGLPAVAYVLARDLDRSWAFAGAVLGFVVALLVDYTFLGVTAVPLDILVHRGAMAVALGFVAAGASRTERLNPAVRNHVRVGVLLWVAATLLPLLKHTPLPV